MNREQAMAMLRELVALDLVEPSFVHISERIPYHYQIQIKSDYNREKIETHAKKQDLIIKEDKERKYLVVFKP